MVPIDTHPSVSSNLLAFLSRSLFPTGLFPSCGQGLSPSCGQGLSHSPHGGKEDPSQSKGVTPCLAESKKQTGGCYGGNPTEPAPPGLVSCLKTGVLLFFFPSWPCLKGTLRTRVQCGALRGTWLFSAGTSLPPSPSVPSLLPPSLHYIIYLHVSPRF